MDGLRKIPDNVPNRQMLEEDHDKPVTSVRDPFGEYPSFGDHNNARLRAFLDGFGFDYEFVSATACYRSGRYDEVLLRVLERFDAVQAIMLPTLGEERRATYSPFLPISPTTGRVLQAPTLERHVERGTIVFAGRGRDADRGSRHRRGVKLQWRPDWAARWTALEVDYEMSGKDLVDSVRVSNRICKVARRRAARGLPLRTVHGRAQPEDLQVQGQRPDHGGVAALWRAGKPCLLHVPVAQVGQAALFRRHPQGDGRISAAAGRLQSAAADGVERGQPAGQSGLERPCGRIRQRQGSPVSFSLLLNLVSAANASDEAILWGFIRRYLPGATPESEPLLDRLAGYAIHYYEDFVRPAKRFRAARRAASARPWRTWPGALKALPADCQDAELIQNEVYAAGKDAGFEPLRAWFSALYEVLLGQSQGPRFGSFAAIFGLDRTIALIERALAGEDLAA